jgi:regulatory protein
LNEQKKNKALNKALSLLSKRSYSKGILTQKLREKEYSDEEILEALKKLEEIGFIDDRRYAENLVREYSVLKHYGAYRIKLKLKEKLISDELISASISEIKQEDELQNIDELAKKHIKRNRHLAKEKIVNRALGYLIRRGYSYEKSRKAIEDNIG